MRKIHSIPELMLLMIFYNTVPLWDILRIPTGIKVVLTVLLSVVFIAILLRGGKSGAEDKRLRRIDRGCSLLWLGGVSAVLEIIVMAVWFIAGTAGAAAKAGAIAMAVLGIGITALTGAVRVAVSSKQIKLKDHIMMLLWWWVPIVNVFLFRRFYKTAQREYIVESDRLELENARAESEICRTKYPVLMVHGIFFRDWQLMNYWGRVPASLKRNGATVYYGNQQSARAVKDSAAELRATILTVLEETGAEKVNIIAHSKGGLDSRYAISCLGMDKHVATLTTINTPHRGCDMVDFLLDKLPDGLAQFIARRYNKIFTVLGDSSPDFMAGVHDLSAIRAKEYDNEMPDSPEVSYRSYMTVMSSAGSAAFPLNVSYLLIKKLNGPNDGLVWEKSAEHGEFRLVTAPHKRGISHGDVIDLMRENIEGYDVREFYVDIVRRLREEGY